MSHPPALARVLLDNAIVLSQATGWEGRIGLHAAAAGGDISLNLFGRCGLAQLPATVSLPPGVGNNNDGRFFFADEPRAEAMATLLDPSR